ncbi:MAG: chloride channel protein [Bacteroidota bacterium]
MSQNNEGRTAIKRTVFDFIKILDGLRSRLQFGSVKLLRAYNKIIPSENQRLFVLTLIIGVVCGLAAVAFHLAIKLLEGYLIKTASGMAYPSSILWIILTPALGGLTCGLLLYYVAPGARGSGVVQVKVAFGMKEDRIPFRDVLGKFFIGALQIGSGSSLGPEGPTVQICAGIAGFLGRGAALSRQNLRRLLPVGAAAGIAAAFNAPIAGVTFAIEEIIGTLDQTVLTGVIVAAAIAAVIERNVLGEHPVLEVLHVYGLSHASSLLLYAVLGVIASGASIAFTDSLLSLRKWFQQNTWIPRQVQPAIGGLVTGILAVAALLWVHSGGITGVGYETLSFALAGKLTITALVVLGSMKILATVFSFGSGGAGGLFAPALFIGSMVGGAVGYLDVNVLNHAPNEIGAFALVGMGAVFAGIVRAPMTSVLVIIEMTGGYSLILPLMIANMITYGLVRHWRPISLYEALMAQDGIRLPHGVVPPVNGLDRLKVGAAMSARNILSLRASMNIEQAFELVAIYNFSSFPVLDDNGTYIGLVNESTLRQMLAEGQRDAHIRGIVHRHSELYADDTLARAVVMMDKYERRQLGVVDRGANRQLIGIITMGDIIHAQAHATLEAEAVPVADVQILRQAHKGM